jgi:hypothetical protein
MTLDCTANLIQLHEQDSKNNRVNAPVRYYVEAAVHETIATLVATGSYATDQDDARLLHDAKVVLLASPTMSTADIEMAISEWQGLNAELVQVT